MTRLLGALILAGVVAAVLNHYTPYGNGRLFAQAPPTEVERLQIENLALKQQLIAVIFRAETCEGKLAPANLATDAQTLDVELAALKQRLEAARPGYTWDGRMFTKKPAP